MRNGEELVRSGDYRTILKQGLQLKKIRAESEAAGLRL
jgi:hypothetical protein